VIALHETAAGVTFAIKVQPRARRNAVVGELGGAVKIALTAPPVDGRANQACIEFLAELLSLPRSAIEIVSGQSSRSKVIRVAGISVQQLRVHLQRVQ
jgi:uncharacterized protein (TIGR00251 family)